MSQHLQSDRRPAPCVHWARKQSCRPGTGSRRRIYDFELLYVAKGELLARFEDRSFRLTAGELLYIPARTWHELYVPEGGAELWGIHFDYYGELQGVPEYGIIVDERKVRQEDFCVELTPAGIPPFSASPVSRPSDWVIDALDSIIREFHSGQPGAELHCSGTLLQILAWMLRHWHRKESAPSQELLSRLRSLARHIEDTCTEKWSAKQVAMRLHLHEDYAARQFKLAFGETPRQFVIRSRMRKAKQLLLDTNWTVERIAMEVGYRDYHYFSRVFRRQEGCTPSAYREKALIL